MPKEVGSSIEARFNKKKHMIELMVTKVNCSNANFRCSNDPIVTSLLHIVY